MKKRTKNQRLEIVMPACLFQHRLFLNGFRFRRCVVARLKLRGIAERAPHPNHPKLSNRHFPFPVFCRQAAHTLTCLQGLQRLPAELNAHLLGLRGRPCRNHTHHWGDRKHPSPRGFLCISLGCVPAYQQKSSTIHVSSYLVCSFPQSLSTSIAISRSGSGNRRRRQTSQNVAKALHG